MGKYSGVSWKFLCAPPDFVAYEKPSFVICRAESEQMRQKMKISVSEEIFTACLSGRDGSTAACLPPLCRERGFEACFHWFSETIERCGCICTLNAFFFVANFVVIWLIVWCAAFPFPLCFWLKIPGLCDTERRHLWPEGPSEATLPEQPGFCFHRCMQVVGSICHKAVSTGGALHYQKTCTGKQVALEIVADF